MAITVTLLNMQLNIYNVYRKLNREYTGELELTQLFGLASTENTIILGDFNAHHPILSSPSVTNEAGRHIAQSLDDFLDIALLNNGQPTHILGGRLDLSFITTALRQIAQWDIA